MSSDTSATTSTIAVGTTKPPSNYGIQQTCKIDISKFPQYYFLLNDDAGGYSLVMYSCAISAILIILLVIYLIISIGGGASLLFTGGWIMGIIKLVFLALFVTAWAGFIILFNTTKNYQRVSKTIRIYNNPKTNRCIITTPGDNTGSKKIYLGSRDSIVYIAFSSLLMILLYSIICVLLFIATIMSFINY